MVQRFWLCLSFFAGVAFSGLCPFVNAQPVQVRLETPRPVSSSSSLSTRVFITDQEGTPYTGLHEENILVTLNDRPISRPSMYTAFADSARLGIVFVVDRSGSVEKAALRKVRKTLQYFANTFAPYDQVGLITFGDNARIEVPLRAPLTEFKSEVRMIQQSGNTALRDAVHQGSKMLASIDADRRALVVFSDGKDTRSERSTQDVLQALQSAQWPVYALGIGDEVNPRLLKKFASSHGGKYLQALNENIVSALYDQLIGPLDGLHYVLQFPFRENSLRAMHEMHIEVQHEGTSYKAGILFSDELAPTTGAR